MIQRMLEADFGLLTLGESIEGTAIICDTPVRRHTRSPRLQLVVENATGRNTILIKPLLAEHTALQRGDEIFAHYTLRRRGSAREVWATDVRRNVQTDTEGEETLDVWKMLAFECRTNRRLLVHALAAIAVCGTEHHRDALVDRAEAAAQLMAAIKELPFGHAWLLTDVIREMEDVS
ncbi:MAG TPA: hypothetical protein VII66_12960 [Gemmatimonadaceae bacterium]